MKKFLLFIFVLFFSMHTTLADVFWRNDLRNLFLNNQAIIYCLNIRNFNSYDIDRDGAITPEKGEITGNFINAIERLNEIKTLGINTIHLLPINSIGKENALGNAGSLYALDSFTLFNPQFDAPDNELSVKEEAKKFVEEAHKRGLRVVIDLPSCGSCDFANRNPELFIRNEKGEFVTPLDWTDVRVFDIQNPKVLELHKQFIDEVISLKIDGLRADVATLKTTDFWKELISYAREKDPQFLFLAEASDDWNDPISPYAPFTNYKDLLSAGFDGYYGSLFNFKRDDFNLISNIQNNLIVFKKYPEKKSFIGAFATHDTKSPFFVGGKLYSEQIIWLNSTLPLNAYYLDGFQSGACYSNCFAKNKPSFSETDSSEYFIHENQFDIFNFSGKQIGECSQLFEELKKANRFKRDFFDVISNGTFKEIKTEFNDVVAFERALQGRSIIVFYNKNCEKSFDVTLNVNNISPRSNIIRVKCKNYPEIKCNQIKYNILPSEIVVLLK